MEGSARTGLLVVGLGGVGSSLIAGVLAARAHLVHPFGSLVEAGGTGRAPGSLLSALRERAPLAELAELELRGQVALYLAARALDASLLIDLAARAGRSGAQEWMDALFASPLGATSVRDATKGSLIERRARLVAELPGLTTSVGRAAA